VFQKQLVLNVLNNLKNEKQNTFFAVVVFVNIVWLLRSCEVYVAIITRIYSRHMIFNVGIVEKLSKGDTNLIDLFLPLNFFLLINLIEK